MTRQHVIISLIPIIAIPMTLIYSPWTVKFRSPWPLYTSIHWTCWTSTGLKLVVFLWIWLMCLQSRWCHYWILHVGYPRNSNGLCNVRITLYRYISIHFVSLSLSQCDIAILPLCVPLPIYPSPNDSNLVTGGFDQFSTHNLPALPSTPMPSINIGASPPNPPMISSPITPAVKGTNANTVNAISLNINGAPSAGLPAPTMALPAPTVVSDSHTIHSGHSDRTAHSNTNSNANSHANRRSNSSIAVPIISNAVNSPTTVPTTTTVHDQTAINRINGSALSLNNAMNAINTMNSINTMNTMNTTQPIMDQRHINALSNAVPNTIPNAVNTSTSPRSNGTQHGVQHSVQHRAQRGPNAPLSHHPTSPCTRSHESHSHQSHLSIPISQPPPQPQPQTQTQLGVNTQRKATSMPSNQSPPPLPPVPSIHAHPQSSLPPGITTSSLPPSLPPSSLPPTIPLDASFNDSRDPSIIPNDPSIMHNFDHMDMAMGNLSGLTLFQSVSLCLVVVVIVVVVAVSLETALVAIVFVYCTP